MSIIMFISVTNEGAKSYSSMKLFSKEVLKEGLLKSVLKSPPMMMSSKD